MAKYADLYTAVHIYIATRESSAACTIEAESVSHSQKADNNFGCSREGFVSSM